ncbi:uncharacterized protein [Magallana gigas]|uniref:uncharacterized protein isoform X3 n=1 Tax=Magallana gigas TaxID=29159 RepID=UPI00333EBD21
MDGFYNSCKRMRINLAMFLMIGSCVQISIAIDGSCPVSPSTVEIVDNCPDSEERWRQAAARKNCTAHASSCSEPDRLVYHCLINSFVNQTLEVCAYGRIIVLGYCTEYSLGGNIVQQSFRATCTQFTEDPCPLGYPSTDAYKYPSCYGLTKKTTATSTLSTTNATYMNNEKKADGGSSKDFLLPVILVVIVALIFAVIGMYLTWKKEKFSFCRKKDHRNIYEEESKSLRVPVDTETEDVHIAPSGQFIGNGIKTKEIKIVDEEILPEHYLKPEENPMEDLQLSIPKTAMQTTNSFLQTYIMDMTTQCYPSHRNQDIHLKMILHKIHVQ